MNNLEIPLGKRSKAYRFFEMVPGLISYTMLGLMVVLSIVNPFYAAVYLLLLIFTLLFKAIGLAFHSVQGHRRLTRAQRIDWRDRLEQLESPEQSLEAIEGSHSSGFDYKIHKENLRRMAMNLAEYPKPSQLYNMVIVAAYNEPYEVIQPTLQSVVDTTYDNKRLILVFAYEERGGEGIRQTAERLKAEFGAQFHAFIPVMHPADLPDEVVGKGPNITYAAEQMVGWLEKEGIEQDDVIITTLDCDNKPHPTYFDYLTYEFIVHEDRQRLSYQPIALYFGNIWDAPAPMRVIATGNSFWTIISSMRPHLLRNFASHAQPFKALAAMDFWSKRTIVEDGHQYWRSYFFFRGEYEVIPLYVPIYQDAVISDTFKGSLVAQFKQLRRWAYGASDVPYVAVRVLSRRRMAPLLPGIARLLRLIDSHVTLATVAILVAVGGWIPLIVSPESARDIAAHNLPEVVSILQRIAMFGLFITIFLSFKILPPRPARYKRRRTIGMVLQWLLMPLTAIAYNSSASLTSQTYLLFGKYLDKFDVTEKSTAETREASKAQRKQAKKSQK